MSISVSKIVNLPQAASKFLVEEETDNELRRDFTTLGGVFSDTDYAWLTKGARLQVIHTKTGTKVGAWSFGWVLKDSNTQIVCVDEIQRPHGRSPLLAVGLDCDFSGGMVCIFDFVTSKVIRAIQVKDRISTLHVIDSGHDVFTLPSPLRSFDGIIAVGTAGGDVFLIDICRQICDEALTTSGLNEIRDELNPCQLSNVTPKDVLKIEIHKEFAVRNSQHLAIHINVVFDKSTKHFTLKGPKGDDRIHVNKDEVTVSALYYCPQLGSLLVGYNFGALQLYNLMNLELVYTSPVCDEHIPISHFAVQEPVDDPRAFCYIWAVYSGSEQFSTCLPLAVMYAFSYSTKEYHEGYGFLYQDFNTAAVHYQMELGIPEGDNRGVKPRGGYCLKLNSINHSPKNREGPNESSEDNLTLCVLVWNVRFTNKETDTFVALFDLNQWYKEQMPNLPNNQFASTYMIQLVVSDLISSATNKSTSVLDVHINKNSLQQFRGAQRLEEHFCPNSISFGMCCLRESDIVHLQNYGVQKALLAQIEMSGPMCLVGPAEMYQEIVGLGLIPLFIDLPGNTPITTNQQREIILGTALENQLIGWLCKCASEWANGSYLSTGCSLDFLISWAFQRAVTLKNNCDNFCIPLFDYSQVRLDNNTNILLNSCTRQLKDLCSLYAFMIRKLYMFISNQELADEQYKSLQMGSVYFEVLQWLLNVGLLPECPLTAYPRSDDLDRINAPYPAELLTDFYNHRRAILKILNEENFASTSSVLFIDTLIENECGGKTLQEQWRNDGGNGLYPPPSLQALLRTYLIDNVELSYKHSVTIYVFLDLAMTLDQEKYKPVITQLIKFPAVFKVSPSVIKITQAFWQLDHGDYNTAMGLLLDPLILREDLKQWHHQVALRSLLLQKQFNFALLYVQVRKPTFVDDDDIKTAISLYVANNMLDEAFYFESYFTRDPRGEKFLLHLFNECKKNDKLRSIIYRTLSAADERIFLKYLLESKEPVAEDLHVYYHILRSHYIEAFESHERTVPNKIENQGLIGQEDAIPRDKLVHSLKKLLPDIKRNVLNLCHKEKNNIWTPVARPTPMSVFVYNNRENVQYKSTLIGAALAKAKQLFSDTVNEKFRLETEVTPFLRTPKAFLNSGKLSAVIVNSEIIDNRRFDEGVSPPKRLKLSPRRGNASFSASIPAKLDTPVVKRKTPKANTTPEEKYEASTPHSILKVRSLANHVASKDDSQFEDDFKAFEKLEYTPVTSKKSGLGLSPRKSLAKTSPVVRFEGLMSSSSSSLNNTSRNLSTLIEKSELSDPTSSIDKCTSSKNTSAEDEIFYSPDTSFEDKDKIESVEVKPIDLNEESVNEVTYKEEETVEERSASPVFSPRSRRSYKRSLGAMSPTRSSPRLSKLSPVPSPQKIETEESLSSVKEDSNKGSLSSPNQNDSFLLPQSPLPKLRPRKSLCRQVLETNALSRVLNSPVESPRNSRSRKVESTVTRTEETVEKLEENLKYDDGEETYTATAITKHNLTTSVIESDLDVSEDYSINYEIAEEPEEPIVLHKIEETESTKKITTEESEEILNNKKIEHETFQKNVFSTNNSLVDEITKSFEIADEEADFNETLKMNEEIHQHHENSANNNCFKEPKLPESSVVADVSDSDIDAVQNDESMDIDNEEKHLEVISISDSTLEIIKEKVPLENEPPENKEDDKDEPTNRPVDPEMNVFEISDDLSVNDGLEIQKEVHVALEENDLCYDQQNTLESVLEENISVTSTPLKVFEKNVFSEDLSDSDDGSSEELNEKSGSGEEIAPRKSDSEDQDSEYSMEKEGDDEESGKSEEIRIETPQKIDENEIIEIGSSSEDEEKHQQDLSEYEEEKNHEESSEYDTDRSSRYYESEDEKPEIRYERRIYDSEDNSLSKSSYERHYSEISENSDDFKDESRQCELFHGDILLTDRQKQNAGQSMSSKSSEDEDHSRESLEDVNVEEDTENIYEDLDEPVQGSRENIPEAKLFDADQFNTVVNEDIEEHLDHDNDTKENFEDTSMNCGLFHGGMFLDSSSSNEETEEALLNKEEKKESETVDEAVGEKVSTIEEEEKSVNNVEIENKTTVVGQKEETEIPIRKEEAVDIQAQVQDIPFEKEKEAALQSDQLDKTIAAGGQEVTLPLDQKLKCDVKHISSLEEDQPEKSKESEMPDPLDATTPLEEHKRCKESDKKMFGNNTLSEIDKKSETGLQEKLVIPDPLDATTLSKKYERSEVSVKNNTLSEMDQKSESKDKTTCRDPLDATIIQPSTSTFGLDPIQEDTSSNSISRKIRSNSVSSKAGKKKGKDSDVNDEKMDQKSESKPKTTCRDPLDATILQPSTSTFDQDPTKEDTSSNSISRKIRSSSVSIKARKKKGKDLDVNNEEMDQKSESEAKTMCKDPLDATIIQPSTSTFGLDPIQEDTSSNSISRKISSNSVSSKAGKKKGKDSDVNDEKLDQKSESKPKTTCRDPLDATIPSTSTFDQDPTKEDTSSNSISRKIRSSSVSIKARKKKGKDLDVNNEEMDQKSESEAKTMCKDPLDATIIQPSTSTFGLDPIQEDTSSNSISKKILSSSVSTKGGKKKGKDSDVSVEAPLSKRNSRVDDKLEVEADSEEKIDVPKRNLRPRRASADQPTDVPAKSLRLRRASADEPAAVAPIRKLRPRRASADEPTSSATSLKRSPSVDELPPSEVKSSKADTTNGRKKRASSVAALPKIVEEDDGGKSATTHKKAKSLLEGYSATRRVTRQQKSLLMRVETGGEGKKLDLEFLDPIVFLDKLPFEGKPDPDEKQVYEESPSSTSSPSTSPQKQSTKLRSASQASERSQRSKSTTPVRSLRKRLKSTDEEEAIPQVTTRSRARSASVSTVNSDDSSVQETVKVGKRRQRVASQTVLPDIQEESNKSEAVVPKKRLRSGSTQK